MPQVREAEPADLVSLAVRLATDDEPTASHLRRSVSTSYYALFHCLAGSCADLLGGGSTAPSAAWRQVYRSLEHGHAKKQCERLRQDALGFPPGLIRFAEEFVRLQNKRHLADYDPDRSGTPGPTDALQDAMRARTAMDLFGREPKKDRWAFAVWVLFRYRP